MILLPLTVLFANEKQRSAHQESHHPGPDQKNKRSQTPIPTAPEINRV
jgi:hypothetical protein